MRSLVAGSFVMLSIAGAGCDRIEANFCESFEKGSLERCTSQCTTELQTTGARERCTSSCQGMLADSEAYGARCSKPPTTDVDRAYCDTYRTTYLEGCRSECEMPSSPDKLRRTCRKECITALPMGPTFQKRCPGALPP